MAVRVVKQSPGGGEYGSWQAAEAVAVASTDTISIQGTWTVDDTTAVTKSAASVDVSTDASAKHPGYYNTSDNHYRLVTSSGHAVTVSAAGSTIDGVVIEQAGTGGSDECIRCSSGVTVKNSIVNNSGNASDQDCIYASGAVTINLENDIIYGARRCNVHLQNNTGTATVNANSCTVFDGGGDNDSGNGEGGFGSDGTGTRNFNIYNCVVVENTQSVNAEDFNESSAANWDIHNSIDSDNSIASRDTGGVGNLASRSATASASPGAGDWVMFMNLTAGSEDLRLRDDATNNDAQDMHSTGSGAGMSIPATDIIGTSRVTTYDCGAFHVAAAGGGATPKGPLGLPLHGPFAGPVGP